MSIQENPMLLRSQVEVTDTVKRTAEEFGRVHDMKDLERFRDFLLQKLQLRPYNGTTRDHEASIRWKRTASEILTDGYVYDTKACTDIVVTFCALCRAGGLETRFLKLVRNNGGGTHSVAEIKLPDGWYFFDVAIRNSKPILWEMDEHSEYKVWRLWGKGRDAWDLGLTSQQSMQKLRKDRIT